MAIINQTPAARNLPNTSWLSRFGVAPLLLGALVSFVQITDPAPADLLFGAAIVCLLAPLPSLNKLELYYALGFSTYIVANLGAAMAWKVASFGAFHLAVNLYLLALPLTISQAARLFGESFVNRLYSAVFVAVGISATIGVLAQVGITPGPTSLFFRDESALRIAPLFQDPNVFAPFMNFGIFPALGFLFSTNRYRRWLLALVFLAGLSLILAFSRAAWLAAATASLVFVVGFAIIERRAFAWRRLVFLALFLTPVAIVAVSWFLDNFDLVDFLKRRFAFQAYDARRFATHREALQLAIQNPFGIGAGHYVGRNFFPDSDFAISTHNLYLKVLVERGFLGFLSYFSILAVCCAALIQSIRKRHRKLISLGVAAAFVGTLVNSYFIDSLHWRHMYILMGLALCEYAIAVNAPKRPYSR